MKTRKTIGSVAAAVMMFGILPLAQAADKVDRFGIVHITAGQTLQLNVANTGDAGDPDCSVSWKFYDTAGSEVKSGSGLLEVGVVVIDTLDADVLQVPTGTRYGIRVTVIGTDPPRTKNNECMHMRSTYEVFDNETKKTLFVGNPDL